MPLTICLDIFGSISLVFSNEFSLQSLKKRKFFLVNVEKKNWPVVPKFCNYSLGYCVSKSLCKNLNICVWVQILRTCFYTLSLITRTVTETVHLMRFFLIAIVSLQYSNVISFPEQCWGDWSFLLRLVQLVSQLIVYMRDIFPQTMMHHQQAYLRHGGLTMGLIGLPPCGSSVVTPLQRHILH